MREVLIVLMVALVTLLTRALPFILFGGDRRIPRPVLSLGRRLPPAVMAILVIYCLRNTNFVLPPHGLCEIAAVASVVLLHLWKRNTLLSIAAGTAVYMALVQLT